MAEIILALPIFFTPDKLKKSNNRNESGEIFPRLQTITRMKTISNEKARLICSHWHAGQWCPLYSFCSTGKIYFPIGHYVQAVEETIKCTEVKSQIKELNSLKNFFLYSGHKYRTNNEQIYNATIPDYLTGFFEDGTADGLTDEEETQVKAYIQALTKDAEKYGTVKYWSFQILNDQHYFSHRNSVNSLGNNVFDCLITFYYN